MVEAAAIRRVPRSLVKISDRSKTPEKQYRCFAVVLEPMEGISLSHILRQHPLLYQPEISHVSWPTFERGSSFCVKPMRLVENLKHQINDEVLQESAHRKKQNIAVLDSPFDRYCRRVVDDRVLHVAGPSGSDDYRYDEQIRDEAARKFKKLELMRLKMHAAIANSHYRFESPERIVMRAPLPRTVFAPETVKQALLAHSRGGTPIRVIPGVSRVYSYSSYAPISYTKVTPHYTYYRSLPSSVYLPSAVPFRYYTRSTPVRVITSPLRDYSPPRIFNISVRPSVIHRELMRIEHKTRPRYGYDPTDEFLNSVHAKEFEDDLRSIRTETSRVLNRVHTPLPRGRRAVSCAPFSRYDSSVTTDREFLEHVRGVPRSVKDDIFTLSRYAEPARKYVGKSHLASVRICGEKGYPIRKPAFSDEIFVPAYPSANRKVRNDVEYMSYYLKNRRAAENGANEPGLDRFRPSRKFSAPRRLEDENAEIKEKKLARANALNSVNEVDEIELEKIRAKRQAEAQLQEAKLAKEEKEKQEAEARRIEEARRKAQEEQERQLSIEKARIEAEKAAQREAEERARREREEQERREAEARAAEEIAQRQAEEAKLKAEEAARVQAEAEAEAARVAAEEEAARQEAARLEAEEIARLEAAEVARQEEEIARLAAEEERRRLEEEAQRLDEDAARLREIESAAKEEREAELARQAAELVEIAKLEAEALRLLEYEQAASELDHPVDNSQSTNADAEEIVIDPIEPVVEEPLTPAAAEDTREDFSEAHATAEETEERTGANAELVTDDEVEPLE